MESLPKEFECGIYFGWASVDDGPVYKMVASVGWNPFYKNEKKTMVCVSFHSNMLSIVHVKFWKCQC